MNLLDRHIFKSVLLTCAAAVGVFTFILMLGNAVKDLLEYVLAGQLPLMTFARLVLLLLPFVVSFALPIGMLTGVLLTLGRLSADSEITAMRAAGISLTRIARPVILLGILGMVVGLYVNFESMPWARVQYHEELGRALRLNPMRLIVPKTFIRQFPGFVVYVGEKQGSILRDIWVWQLDHEGRVSEFYRAASGHVDYNLAANDLVLTATDAEVEKHDEKFPEDMNRTYSFFSAVYGPQHLPTDRIFGRGTDFRKKDAWRTYSELMEKRRELADAIATAPDKKAAVLAEMKVRLTIQEKFNTAIAVFSLALIGVPLGIKVSRRETFANFGVAVLLALGYYMMTVMVGWLDRHPEYRPDILFWLPNVIMLALGAKLFGQIDRR